ncbi:hypothetical protein ACLOJK_023988 [Asimina triloba]
MVGFGRTAGSCSGHGLDAGCVWWVVIHLDGRWIEGQGRRDRRLFGVRRREELMWVAPLDGCSLLDLEGRRRRTPAIAAVGVMGERAGAAMGVMDGRMRLQAWTARWVADEARGEMFGLLALDEDGAGSLLERGGRLLRSASVGCWIGRTLVMEAVWSSGLRALLDHDGEFGGR